MIAPPPDDSPDAILDRLRHDPALTPDDREALLGRLVERFPADRLIASARARFGDLGGDDATAVLRLAEAFGDGPVFDELARALIAQPGLAAERAWEALSVLDGLGVLADYPELLERWDDLSEALDGDAASIAELAAGLEESPDGSWLALEGLAAIEPEVRPEIIAGIADRPGGPGLVAFLRLLAFAHDSGLRSAALDALDDRPDDSPGVLDAWRSIAASHPDPGVVDRARDRLDRAGASAELPARPSPEPIRSLVTAIDGEGRASIVLASTAGGRWAGAAFLCHALRGIVDVAGTEGEGLGGLDEAFAELVEGARSDVVEDRPALALGLLAGSLSLCGPGTSPALRYWIERTAGTDFRAEPASSLLDGWDPSSLPFDEMPRRAREVVRACPGWADSSEIGVGLAREVALRGLGEPPDPRRDAGAYRFLFEHRLADRIELYTRMLLWMAAFWRGSGADDLGHSALAIAWQLSDAQHAVPSHPFFVELTTLSFEAANLP